MVSFAWVVSANDVSDCEFCCLISYFYDVDTRGNVRYDAISAAIDYATLHIINSD